MTSPWCPASGASSSSFAAVARGRYKLRRQRIASPMTRGLGIIGNCSYSALLKEGRSSGCAGRAPTRASSSGRSSTASRAARSRSRASTRPSRAGVRREHERAAHRLLGRERARSSCSTSRRASTLYDRFFKPSMLVRILRPLSGEPRARVRCRPTYEYGLEEIGPLAGVEPHRVHRASRRRCGSRRTSR